MDVNNVMNFGAFPISKSRQVIISLYTCALLRTNFGADELETNRYMTRMNAIDLHLKHSLHKVSIMSIAETDVIGVRYAGLIMGPIFVKIACLIYWSGSWQGL
jgi:hypothetical protein